MRTYNQKKFCIVSHSYLMTDHYSDYIIPRFFKILFNFILLSNCISSMCSSILECFRVLYFIFPLCTSVIRRITSLVSSMTTQVKGRDFLKIDLIWIRTRSRVREGERKRERKSEREREKREWVRERERRESERI